MMPGPLLALTIGEVTRRGFWAGPQLILGHGILEIALLVALVAGLSELMENDLVPVVAGLLGGTILVGMGLMTMRQVQRKVGMPEAERQAGRPSRMLVLTGVVGSISNPYWLIWWITLGMAYLVWSLKLGFAGVASFFTGHILADLAWYSLVAFIIATGRRVISDAVYQGLLMACGLALLSLGGYFIFLAARSLSG
jgi:threonine/homoserine/homoserine lactone efflux protein